MSFLDELRRQAVDLQAKESTDQEALARSTAAVEAAATEAGRYLYDLGRQLDVIHPVSPSSYRFDNRTSLEGLPMVDFRFDTRRRPVHGQDLTDHIYFGCVIRGREPVVLKRDFVADIEKLEARIRQSGVHCETQTVRNPANGRVTEIRYEFLPEVHLGLKIVPDHEHGVLRFTLRNLGGLETVECEFVPSEIGQGRLDELARWWVGQPHRFLDGAREMRRVVTP